MTPYFRIFCTPLALLPDLVNIDDAEIRELVRRPPHTREGGWTIWGAREVLPSMEGLEAVGLDGRRLFVLKNGHIEYWQPCRSETFQWAQAESEQSLHPWLYPYAICELPVNFLMLANRVYEHTSLDCDVHIAMAYYSIQGFILIPYRPRSVAFITGGGTRVKPYGKQDLKTLPVTSSVPIQQDQVAFELVKQVYHEFGFGVDDIYLFDEHGNFHPGGG